MRLYVIGPVTGRPDRNRAEFEAARARLEADGHEVTTPLDIVPPDATHERAMRVSLCWLLLTGRVDGVATLRDWFRSPGARVEQVVAEECGIEERDWDDWGDAS